MPVDEEFELVPMSPIRRIEKRLDRIEDSGMSGDLLKELMNVVKTNQQVVDDVVRINSQMIARVSDLSNSVSDLSNKLNDFMNRLEVQPNQKEENSEQSDKMAERVGKLEKRINTLLVAMTKSRQVRHSPQRQMPPAPMAMRRKIEM